MICNYCHKRNAIRGVMFCQRCERALRHGPVHEPECSRCLDAGRVYIGGCDIPGCRHYRYCTCSKGAELEREARTRADLIYQGMQEASR